MKPTCKAIDQTINNFKYVGSIRPRKSKLLPDEISKLKETDKFNRTHTCYVTKLQEETTEENSPSTGNNLPFAANSSNNPVVPEKTKKPRTKKN